MHHRESAADGGDPLAAARRAAQQREGQGPSPDDHDHSHHGAESNDASQRTITAFLVGLKSRVGALFLQRKVNEWREEPLTAILPGATLLEVWEVVAGAEKTLIAISALVVVMGLAGMLIALLTSLSERRREMAVLRAIGARPWHVFALLLGEATFLALLGVALGLATLYVGLGVGRPWLEQQFGLFITLRWPSVTEFEFMTLIVACGVMIGLIPAYRIYRLSLADGMTIRI